MRKNMRTHTHTHTHTHTPTGQTETETETESDRQRHPNPNPHKHRETCCLTRGLAAACPVGLARRARAALGDRITKLTNQICRYPVLSAVQRHNESTGPDIFVIKRNNEIKEPNITLKARGPRTWKARKDDRPISF